MPKVKVLSAIVNEFGSVFEQDDSDVVCKLCGESFNNPRRCVLLRHIESNRHKKLVTKQATNTNTPTPLNEKKLSTYNSDLCRALIEADIPLYKLQHKSFREFLEKYTKRPCPDESTVRKNYVSSIYMEKLEKIRSEIMDSKIWISIDETTDSMGRAVANVVVGTLDPKKEPKSYVLACEVLQSVNSESIANLFIASLKLLWPSGIRHNSVLLYLSDAAAYMVKSGKCLKPIFPRMIHVTCVAHGLHRVAEEVRNCFPDVDALISNIKKIFVKCNSRVQKFKATLQIPLPPQPIITRWGTWIEAACYYAENFDSIKTFVCGSLVPEDAASIRQAQLILQKSNIRDDLLCITNNFRSLPETIRKLEANGLQLLDSLEILNSAGKTIDNINVPKLESIRKKYHAVLAKNSGLSIMKVVLSQLNGDTSHEALADVYAEDILCLKHAPLVSCEVERSFSKYKAIFRDNRNSFTFENLKMHIIIACNSNVH
jgi:hypothetical protein